MSLCLSCYGRHDISVGVWGYRVWWDSWDSSLSESLSLSAFRSFCSQMFAMDGLTWSDFGPLIDDWTVNRTDRQSKRVTTSLPHWFATVTTPHTTFEWQEMEEQIGGRAKFHQGGLTYTEQCNDRCNHACAWKLKGREGKWKWKLN